MKHKTEDYKMTAVKYYLKENKKQSLFRCVNRYSRKQISYKITYE